jgi:hypothetical protein
MKMAENGANKFKTLAHVKEVFGDEPQPRFDFKQYKRKIAERIMKAQQKTR